MYWAEASQPLTDGRTDGGMDGRTEGCLVHHKCGAANFLHHSPLFSLFHIPEEKMKTHRRTSGGEARRRPATREPSLLESWAT